MKEIILSAILFCFILFLCFIFFCTGFYFGKTIKIKSRVIHNPPSEMKKLQLEKAKREEQNFWDYNGNPQEETI